MGIQHRRAEIRTCKGALEQVRTFFDMNSTQSQVFKSLCCPHMKKSLSSTSLASNAFQQTLVSHFSNTIMQKIEVTAKMSKY